MHFCHTLRHILEKVRPCQAIHEFTQLQHTNLLWNPWWLLKSVLKPVQTARAQEQYFNMSHCPSCDIVGCALERHGIANPCDDPTIHTALVSITLEQWFNHQKLWRTCNGHFKRIRPTSLSHRSNAILLHTKVLTKPCFTQEPLPTPCDFTPPQPTNYLYQLWQANHCIWSFLS